MMIKSLLKRSHPPTTNIIMISASATSTPGELPSKQQQLLAESSVTRNEASDAKVGGSDKSHPGKARLTRLQG